MTKGGRNLVLLTTGTISIAIITTAISLFVYRNSGDIYIDRSRPGYLPDKSETKTAKSETKFVFPDTGNISRSTIKEYREQYQKVLTHLHKIKEPYSPAALSDQALGIPEAESKN